MHMVVKWHSFWWRLTSKTQTHADGSSPTTTLQSGDTDIALEMFLEITFKHQMITGTFNLGGATPDII